MNPQTILYFLVAIVVLRYLFDQFLEWLNLRSQRPEIPADVADFYDREKYLKSLDYHHDQTYFSFLISGVSVGLSVIMLLAGGFGWLDGLLRSVFSSEIPLALAFFAVLAVASDVVTLPFQWYAVFVLEEKYGFNKTTVNTFVSDKLKGYLLGGAVGGVLISLMIYLMQQIGPGFWWIFGLVAAVFILLTNLFYTSWILPLFNRLTPLPEGELKSAIQAFAQKVNFPLDNIFVMDGSKRSSKANAFFAGIGAKKKIVLFDTLIANHTIPELVAVLAHEVGHFKKKHIVFGYLLSAVQIFFMLWVLSLMVFNPNVSLALAGSQPAIHLNLIAFTILFAPISGLTGLLMSIYSRKNEFEADRFARDTADGRALAEALKKLSVNTLSELFPHPAYVFFHYSHPPLLQRLAALKE